MFTQEWSYTAQPGFDKVHMFVHYRHYNFIAMVSVLSKTASLLLPPVQSLTAKQVWLMTSRAQAIKPTTKPAWPVLNTSNQIKASKAPNPWQHSQLAPVAHEHEKQSNQEQQLSLVSMALVQRSYSKWYQRQLLLLTAWLACLFVLFAIWCLFGNKSIVWVSAFKSAPWEALVPAGRTSFRIAPASKTSKDMNLLLSSRCSFGSWLFQNWLLWCQTSGGWPLHE